MKNLISAISKLGIILTLIKTMFSYLDPGSGSLIIQLLIAMIVGFLATFRFWKAKLLSLLGMRQESDDDDDDDLDEDI